MARQVELGVADADLTVPQYRVLGLLDTGSTGATLLATRLEVRPPSVTAVVDGLVAKGLVDRRPAAEDRRRISLSLTDAGRLALSTADEAVDRRLHQLAAASGDPKAEAAALRSFEVWHRAMVAAAGRKLEDARTRALERGL